MPENSGRVGGEVDDETLKKVIADFLDMGHVENIVAMFRHEPRYYAWTGALLNDSRLQVRLGMTVLFEELAPLSSIQMDLAVSSLVELLRQEPAPESYVRGDALGILAIIGGDVAFAVVRSLLDDPDFRVAEVARDILEAGE